jgi:hypothetical protein
VSKLKQAPSSNEIPEYILLKMSDLLVLYHNLYKAAEHPKIGYVDADRHFSYLLKQAFEKEVPVKTEVAESLLWACIQLEELEEGSEFWHPNGLGVNTFIARLMHHKKFRFYFDKIYNFFRSKKPRVRIPEEAIIKQEEEENV